MAIEDLIPTRFMNTSRQQEADIEQSQSASRLNNVQSHRILSLLPGEMEQQALSSAGLNLDNIMKGYQIEGQQINNRIGVLGERRAQLENISLEVQAENAEVNMELEQQAKKQEIALTKARIAESAATTKLRMGELALEQQKLYQQQIYPQVAAKFSTIGKLAKGGDLAGANSLYQSLIKQLPPDFLQFEGKSGMDLLGPEIDPKDLEPLPGTGGMSLLDIFTEHARMLVPADSLQGQSMLQEQQDNAAMARTRVTANAKSASDVAKAQKNELQTEKLLDERLGTPMAQIITGGSTNKRRLFDENDEPVAAANAYAFSKLKDLAKASEKDNRVSHTDIAKNFTIDSIDPPGLGGGLDDVIVPKNAQIRKAFIESILEKLAQNQDLTIEEAYQQEIDEVVNGLASDIFQ